MRNLLLCLLLLLAVPAQAADMTVVPAIDGIFAAFRTHPLVGIGEHHRIQQELDFYSAVIRDPRFAADVGNVVVEFGGAAHQDIIDRYINGEEVPYTELRKVWTDTVGWIPVVTSIGYPAFFAQVREVNLALPPGQRIHVWLGDPAIDWDKIKTHAEWQVLDRQRDSHPAALIEREILAPGKKALIIYGGGHFTPPLPGSVGEKMKQAGWRNDSWADTIRQRHPGALYVVLPYNGTPNKACANAIESGMAHWPVPALATPLKGSDVAARLRVCNMPKIADGDFPPSFTDADKQQVAAFYADTISYGDGLLYLGPSATLTYSPYIPDLYLDEDYNRTVARHYLLQTGEAYPTYKIQDYVASRKVRP